METCIAVDIGGTKMLVAEVRENGQIINIKRYPTGKLGREEILKGMVQGVYAYESEIGWENGKRPKRMGTGINGLIDPVKGVWKKHNESDREIAVTEFIEKELGVKCYADNDVKATVIAENKFGAGIGCRDMVYINLGTGLSAGIIANGKLIRGSDGFAGEIGFMNLTGGEGVCAELRVSGMGMSHQTKALLERYPESMLRNRAGGIVRGQDVFEMAEQGDEMACHILDEMVKMTGLVISNLTCVLSPEVVILGGGLITDNGILERITGEVTQKARAHLEKGVILTGLQTAYAGLMGAAAIALGCQQEYF